MRTAEPDRSRPAPRADGGFVRLRAEASPEEAAPGNAFAAIDRAFGIALSLVLTASVLLAVILS